MASIASKNLYDLLGNDPELDPDREPEPPTKAIDKPVQRAGKRNAGAEGPPPGTSRPRGGGRGGRENFTGNEQAFRDRGAGSYQNRSRNPDDGARQDRHPDRLREPGEYRGRGGRGGRGRGRGGPREGDRHSRTGIAEHQKQADQGWGAPTGEGEWNDEKAGEAIAKEEEKEGFDSTVPPPVDGEGNSWEGDAAPAESAEPAEPEDKTKSYADYLAEQAEKKLHLGGSLSARKANEGSSKKFPEGKAVTREDEEDFISASGGKKIRERERKEKNLLELDGVRMRPEEERRGFGGRGGRGRGRGGGEFRGDRGGRGRGGGRGSDFRPRGGRGGAPGGGPNVDDQSAFPSLGS